MDARDSGRGGLLLLLGLHRHPDPGRLPRRPLSRQSGVRLGHRHQRPPEHAAAHRGQGGLPVRDVVAHFAGIGRGKYSWVGSLAGLAPTGRKCANRLPDGPPASADEWNESFVDETAMNWLVLCVIDLNRELYVNTVGLVYSVDIPK